MSACVRCNILRGLEPIGEASASILSPSDISFDKTEEDLDTSYLRSGKKWKRGASVGRPSAPDEEAEKVAGKRSRRTVSTLDVLQFCDFSVFVIFPYSFLPIVSSVWSSWIFVLVLRDSENRDDTLRGCITEFKYDRGKVGKKTKIVACVLLGKIHTFLETINAIILRALGKYCSYKRSSYEEVLSGLEVAFCACGQSIAGRTLPTSYRPSLAYLESRKRRLQRPSLIEIAGSPALVSPMLVCDFALTL